MVVGVHGKGLRLLRRDAGVALDRRRHDAAGCLESKGQRGGVDHEEVVDLRAGLPREDSRLHRGAVRHGLVRVDALAQFFAVEELLEHLLELRDPRRAAHEDDLGDLRLGTCGRPSARARPGRGTDGSSPCCSPRSAPG